MNTHLVDVIMPTYNRAKALTKVMDSYLCQENLGRIIFVDDCSTDDTAQYVASLAAQHPGKIVYHLMPKKTTLTNVRNVGISLARSDLIFMGEDDVLLPKDHFRILVEKMNQYGADIIAGRRIYMWADQTTEEARVFADMDKRPIFVRVPFEAYFERCTDKAQSVPTLHSNALMKRSVFSSVKYDTDFGAFRDETDFYLRAWDAGFKLWLIPDTLSYHLKNTSINSAGGARRKWFAHERHVWENTTRLFLKNRDIFTKKLEAGNIYWYLVRCLAARYTYAVGRRIDQKLNRKKYEQA